MECLDEKDAEPEGGRPAEVPSAVMAAVDGAKAEAEKVSADRRNHRRVPGSSLDWLSAARVKYGPEVSIIDLSRGGVLLQSDRPLNPGSKQALEIVGTEKSIVVPFGVLRSKITALSSKGPIYRAACAFTRPLELPELAAAAAQPATMPTPEQVTAATAPAITLVPPADPAAAAVAEPSIEVVDLESEEQAPAEFSDIDEAPTPGVSERVVARFMDGKTMKGFTRDFIVSRPEFSIFQSPEAPDDSVSVPFADLKAVFFVRHFAGNAEYRERKTFHGPAHGRKIQVTFNDGETLVGTTQAYRAGGTGFFVTPADPRANNVRVFVLSSAVRQVHFP